MSLYKGVNYNTILHSQMRMVHLYPSFIQNPFNQRYNTYSVSTFYTQQMIISTLSPITLISLLGRKIQD